VDTPTATTRLIALLGDPVGHSASPALQNAAFRAAGVDGVYLALRCAAADFPHLLAGIARAGGGGNVTLPHKERAATLLDLPTAAVRRTGACNTFWEERGSICGDNTDVTGTLAAIRTLIGAPAGARVLLLGAGGAARAVLCALLDGRADAIVLANRTLDHATTLREIFDPSGRRVRVAKDLAELRREGFDLLVNATSLGLRPDDPLPLDLSGVRRAGAVLDLVYGPRPTPWVAAARARAIPAADGREMLLHQGAAAFERWWSMPAPLDAMRAALAQPSPPA
jgi:shikimate dehydrogenase